MWGSMRRLQQRRGQMTRAYYLRRGVVQVRSEKQLDQMGLQSAIRPSERHGEHDLTVAHEAGKLARALRAHAAIAAVFAHDDAVELGDELLVATLVGEREE